MTTAGSKETMAKNIRFYMQQHGRSRQDMCKALDVKYTTFTEWVKGNAYPRIDKIERMAAYFHITKADLIEDHETSPHGNAPYYLDDKALQIAQEISKTPELYALFQAARELPPAQLNAYAEFMVRMREGQEKQI